MQVGNAIRPGRRSDLTPSECDCADDQVRIVEGTACRARDPDLIVADIDDIPLARGMSEIAVRANVDREVKFKSLR